MCGDQEKTIGGGTPRRFESTHWSMVLAAGHRSLPSSEHALSQLCEKYWYPLYAHVRSRVTDVHEAQDLTQAFFTQLLDKNFIGDADPQRGRFRTFLLAALNHFLANEWDKAMAKKRGGDRIHIALDLGEGERRFCQEPTTDVTPEKIYERQWALTLLRVVLSKLREEQEAGGKKDQFERWLSVSGISQAIWQRSYIRLGGHHSARV